ncbi:MAG: hypothetical protein ACK55Z_12245, partial [bacterium]
MAKTACRRGCWCKLICMISQTWRRAQLGATATATDTATGQVEGGHMSSPKHGRGGRTSTG